MAFFKRAAQIDYLAEFRQVYGSLINDGPTSPAQLDEWAGPSTTASAQDLAVAWRRSELEDAEMLAEAPGPYYFRVSLYGRGLVPYATVDESSKRTVVMLGEQLYDAGALGAPYDENLPSDPNDEWASSPGKARLFSLMYLSIYAYDMGHPKAMEWTQEARTGIAMTPGVEPTIGLAQWWAQMP